jgi:bifunctional UDP-N-acetylglucosamine pyrophosphorylase/glucosamine-1-phosphate N-acetyltransferase
MSPKQKTSSKNVAAPRVAIAIMAAGKGIRLKSRHPKVLHEVGGKPLLAHVIASALKIVPRQDVYAIVGHEADRVRAATENTGIRFVLQEPQRGTGHAIMAAREFLPPYDLLIVLSGDAPLITPGTIEKLRDAHWQSRAAMTLLSADLAIPTGYGRVIRQSPKSDEVRAIVEEKSATPAQRKIHEINSGFYAFAVGPLIQHLDQLGTDNPHSEYYLTDMAATLRKAKHKVIACKIEDANEILGTNTRAEMVQLDAHVRLSKARELMTQGVTVFYPESCVVDGDVEVGTDTIIEPFVQLLGNTRIGSDCRIRSYSVITNSQISDHVLVNIGTIIEDSQVSTRAVVGPYARIRPGSEIGEEAHVGNFVETKKVRLGKRSKANHLSYLGDAEIGSGVNIGAGTITCNYDGVNKHRTLIEDGVFVGSDSTLVAPVKLGRGSYVGAGSCITEEVPADSLAIGRARQTTKENWAKTKRAQQAALVPKK